MTYNSIVVLTGAGISAESGIKTFRDANGLWENHRIEEVASPEGFMIDPDLVHNFYNQRRRQLLSGEVHPNAAHVALAKLEKQFPGDFLLVTQNVDDLHERAGSEQLIHMHGEILKMRCGHSGQLFDVNRDASKEDRCICCEKTGMLRPHVVWFGEEPLEMPEIFAALKACDLFVSIGTSGNVYPAAGFVQEASSFGAHTIELNLEPTMVRSQFREQLYGPATSVVPEFVEHLLRESSHG